MSPELLHTERAVHADERGEIVTLLEGIPAQAIERHRSDPAVRFIEDVPRLEDFYREVGVFINPVRSGRGLRTKLIEAAAYGRPVLSTALGAEGLDGLGITLAEAPAAMLAGFRALLEPDRWQRAVETGRRAVEAKFSLSAVGRELLGILSCSS